MADSNPTPPPADTGGAATVEKAKPSKKTNPRNQTDRLPPYNVVLLDDDHHTYEYVIEMLGKIFGYDKQKAFKLREDIRGRVFGTLTSVISGLSLIPLVVVGPIADRWGVAPVFAGAAAVVWAVRLAGGRGSRSQRRM